MLDFMAGSIYALNGAVKSRSRNIFILPDNIDVSGVDIEEENQDKSSLASK